MVFELKSNKYSTSSQYRGANYSFKNTKGLFKKIRDEMNGFGGPKWNAEDIVLPGTQKADAVTLLYRDLQECGDFQFGRPWFAGRMSFAPERHYDADETTQLYENPWTAEDWNERQVSTSSACQLSELTLQNIENITRWHHARRDAYCK